MEAGQGYIRNKFHTVAMVRKCTGEEALRFSLVKRTIDEELDFHTYEHSWSDLY